MNQLTAELNAAKALGDHKRKKAAKHRRKYRLISARANHVTRAMKARYETETGARLKIFCVGNHAYEKLCELGDADRVRATGIPAVRLYCHTITADTRLAEARYWIKTTVPGFLQSAEAWAHRMLTNVNVGEELQQTITSGLSEIRHKVCQCLAKSIIRTCSLTTQVPAHVAKLLRMALEASWVQFMETWSRCHFGLRSYRVTANKFLHSCQAGRVGTSFRPRVCSLGRGMSNTPAHIQREQILTRHSGIGVRWIKRKYLKDADIDLKVSYNAWCRHNGHHRTRVAMSTGMT
jgi:hypothetical protein